MSEISNDSHVRIGEQNIDKKDFSDITLKGAFELPAIKVTTSKKITGHALNSLKNTLDMKEGRYFIYLELGGRLRCMGKVELDISTIHRIQNIFKRLEPVIEVAEKEDVEFKEIKYTDYIGTIKL